MADPPAGPTIVDPEARRMSCRATAENCHMATFMDVHSGFVGVTQAAARARRTSATSRSRTSEGVHFERAWLDPDLGQGLLPLDRPEPESVMRIHERAGHPTAEVYELPIEVA